MKSAIPFLILAAMFAAGCGTDYCWRSSVPKEYRTISVPNFRNESKVMEAGVVASRQLLRELQREGTFRIAGADDAVLEIQGKIVSGASGVAAYNRRSMLRNIAYNFSMTAEITVVDKRRGRVLVDNRRYVGETTFTTGQDVSNAERGAAGRAADDIARQVVDDLLRMDFNKRSK